MLSTQYNEQLDHITLLAEANNFDVLSKLLSINIDVLIFSESCVANNLRKGFIIVGNEQITISNFTHMCRVAFMVHYFFPDDEFSRVLAVLHDIKEEAIPGMERVWQQSDEITKMDNIVKAIDILTEITLTPEQIEDFTKDLPPQYEKKYVAVYRKFVPLLHTHWDLIGNMELCDRLDASTNFSYLMNPKFDNRRPDKARETFGRIWATIDISHHCIVGEIKGLCRTWFPQFNITESEVEKTAKIFYT